MPANLTPEYHRAEDRWRTAKTTPEKIAALEEMLRVIPKHKGTDALQGDLRARLAKLRKQPAPKAGRATFSHAIAKEGAGQVALVGPPNSGKSSLVATLTHAKPEVADYPFTTREATPGMMRWQDVGLQLIDLPPLSDEHVDPWVYDLVRAADLVWVVLDGEDTLDGMDLVRRQLEAKNLGLRAPGTAAPGEPPGRTWKRAILVVTGVDRHGVAEGLPLLEEWLGGDSVTVAVSTVDGRGLDELGRRTFDALDRIRVYTKKPGHEPDRTSPFALPRGARVGDLAEAIHKDLPSQMRFARVWGPSAFEGQTVHEDHVLADGDVVEIHL